ncbi:MAG: HU family DNA-binding protein [Natronohydrobacter sp.]|nr:HU family DNA-binding protein [Natronohydrobacter sp.]
MSKRLSKSELIQRAADVADCRTVTAAAVIDAALAEIIRATSDGASVQIQGFGTFSARSRAARTGRNPRTGEPVEIKASTTLGFKASKALKA